MSSLASVNSPSSIPSDTYLITREVEILENLQNKETILLKYEYIFLLQRATHHQTKARWRNITSNCNM